MVTKLKSMKERSAVDFVGSLEKERRVDLAAWARGKREK